MRFELTLASCLAAGVLTMVVLALWPHRTLHRGIARLTIHYEVVPMPEDLPTYDTIRIDQRPRWTVKR